MKLYVILSAVILISLVSCESKPKYSPERSLTENEQSQILYTTIRYLGHLPKRGTYENRFEAQFDEYYSKLVLDFEVEAYHKDGDFEYFLASRVAPSIKVKKVAVGVKMKRNETGELTYYEEVFRTWKFEIPEMKKKGLMLFDKMVKGEDLSPYYIQNSAPEEFIEFPDDKVYFDIEEKRWKVNSSNDQLS
ncbi:hypothetical protein [Aquiflexum sp.]|uniref:hypothetical protein n=1 Tax=Aquiflexum sp. TaxID=1872584 RepID=UPI0035935CD0